MEIETAEAQRILVARGMDALIDKLGIVDAIRFMQIIHGTSGDYTAERHKWLDDLTLAQILEELQRLRTTKDMA